MAQRIDTPMTFADRYQSVLVPVIFEPWAEELVSHAPPRGGDRILDLACGTGVVTRHIVGLGTPLSRVAAADHSREMLNVAKSLSPATTPAIEWEVADAAHLPFADGAFDRVYCQQALQFFPDRVAALRDVRRVLAPGGTVAICVQRGLDVNPMLKAQAHALDTCVGTEAGDAVRAICSLSDAADLQTAFKRAGFSEIDLLPVTLTLGHPDARAFAQGAMGGMHTGDKLAGMEGAGINSVVAVFLEALGDCYDGTGMAFPHASHVVIARK